MAGLSKGLSGLQHTFFGDKKKRNYELLKNEKVEDKSSGLTEGLSGLMVGRKDITA